MAFLRVKYVPRKGKIYGPYWELVYSVRVGNTVRQHFIRYYGKNRPMTYDKGARRGGSEIKPEPPPGSTPPPYAGATVKPELVGNRKNSGEKRSAVYSHTYDGVDIYIEEGSKLTHNDIATVKEAFANMTEGQKKSVDGILLYESPSRYDKDYAAYYMPMTNSISIFRTNSNWYKQPADRAYLHNSVAHEAGHVTYHRMNQNREDVKVMEYKFEQEFMASDEAKKYKEKQSTKYEDARNDMQHASDKLVAANDKKDWTKAKEANKEYDKAYDKQKKIANENKEFEKAIKEEARDHIRQREPDKVADAEALENFETATTKEGYVTTYSQKFKSEPNKRYNENLAESFAIWRTGIAPYTANIKTSGDINRTAETMAKERPETYKAFKEIEKRDEATQDSIKTHGRWKVSEISTI